MGMCQDITVVSLHVVLEWWCRHRFSTNLITYPCHLPLSERISLSCHPPVVRLPTLLSLYWSRVAYHCLCLPQFFCSPTLSNIHTITNSVFFTQMGFLPAMWPLYEKKITFYLPAAHPILWCTSCGAHTSIITALTTLFTIMLNNVRVTGSPWVTPLSVLNVQT